MELKLNNLLNYNPWLTHIIFETYSSVLIGLRIDHLKLCLFEKNKLMPYQGIKK
jgi:hypothetical protein